MPALVELIEITRQDLHWHSTPRLSRVHVWRVVQMVAQMPAMCLPQRIRMEKISRYGTKLVVHLDSDSL